MPYCTSTDVQNEVKGLDLSATGAILTTSTVDGWIIEAGALVNSYVGQRYVVPITASADALALMSLYTRTLVVMRVRAHMRTVQASNQSANANVHGSDGLTVKDVMKALEAIAKGDLALDGAVLLLADGGFFSSNYASGQQPTVNKNRRQW